MADYLRNINTDDLVKNINLGRTFVPPTWVDATQDEIDAWQLTDAQTAKTAELKNDLAVFETTGYVYDNGVTTDTFTLSDETTNNINLKNLCPGAMPDRYKFYDKDKVKIDFVNNTGFDDFQDAMFTEKDRIMVKYNDYRKQINDATTVAEVDAITISFSV